MCLLAYGRRTVLGVISLLISCSCSEGFNLDTQYPVIYEGGEGTYFGYTTALHRNKYGSIALVGAPRANTTTLRVPVFQPGTLFQCTITEYSGESTHTCQEVMLMTEGATEMRREYAFAYQDYKNGMWLGVSLVVRPSSTENEIVTCGHLWRNQYHPRLHLVNGVCYVINGDLEVNSVRKLLPLTQRSFQFSMDSKGRTEYNHAHGQAGMSASFSEDGSNLILGAPGVWSWTGSYVNYPVNSGNRNNTYKNPVIPTPAYEIDFNSYFGYSVTTGRFFESRREMVAIGAPRDGKNFGKVYIIRQVNNNMRIHQREQGTQLGEYFGASVLGVNINNDQYTDLLVGAPFNSLESIGDEGKVYVYISNGKDLQKNMELTGDRKANGRFGTALANIGDLNLDGFTDIAVGAPYEDDHGAVYIYHGSYSGIKPKYSQKIAAININTKLSGFGIHISSGLDIDDNGYPDILVGAYASSTAVLFRSRTFIEVSAEVNFEHKRINMNEKCLYNGANVTCFQVDACVWYTEKHITESLEGFELDVRVEDSRGWIQRNKERSPFTKRQKRGICSPHQVYLRPNIKDVITPIKVSLRHSLKDPEANPTRMFPRTFPIYHPDSPTTASAEIFFQTDCKKDEECRSDLIVSATRIEPTGNLSDVITLGKISSVSVTIIVTNVEEPAYATELFIYLPPEMPSINQDFCELGNQQNNASLVCDIANPLRNGTTVEIHIKLDATKIPPHTRYLEIGCRAVTLSTDINPDDNIDGVALYFETQADIGITGSTSHSQIMYDGLKQTSPIITHTYTVLNHGPSPLQTVAIILRVPYLFSTSEGHMQFVTFTDLKVDSGARLSIPVVCNDSSLSIEEDQTSHRGKPTSVDDQLSIVDIENISVTFPLKDSLGPPSDLRSDVEPADLITEKESRDKKDNAPSSREPPRIIDCNHNNALCVELRCFAAPFTNLMTYAQISVDFQLNFTILDKNLDSWREVEFISTCSISVEDSLVIELDHHPARAEIKTVLMLEGPPPQPELPPWVIFVSVGVGVILLLIILIIFIKIGFFKRKEKDIMKELLYDSKKEDTSIPQPAEGPEIVDE